MPGAPGTVPQAHPVGWWGGHGGPRVLPKSGGCDVQARAGRTPNLEEGETHPPRGPSTGSPPLRPT